MLLTNAGSDPLYRRAIRVSMGTVFQIPWTTLPLSLENGGIDLLHEYGFKCAALEDFRQELHSTDLLIYALPVALDVFPELKAEDFSSRPIVLEANYRDPAFDGLTLARLMDGGAKYISGNVWLMNQAVSGYSIMTGEAPDVAGLLSSL